MNVFVLPNTKEDILKNVGNTTAVLGHHWLLWYFFLLWRSMVPQNSLVTNFLQNIFLCVRHSYRFGNTWGWVNDNSHFWVNYPFNNIKWVKHFGICFVFCFNESRTQASWPFYIIQLFLVFACFVCFGASWSSCKGQLYTVEPAFSC